MPYAPAKSVRMLRVRAHTSLTRLIMAERNARNVAVPWRTSRSHSMNFRSGFTQRSISSSSAAATHSPSLKFPLIECHDRMPVGLLVFTMSKDKRHGTLLVAP